MSKNGLNMNCYYDTSGVGVGTWTDGNESIINISYNATRGTPKIKTRGSQDEKALKGFRVRSVEIELDHDPSDAFWIALNANFESEDDSFLGLALMDGPLPASGSNSVGVQMDMIVEEFSQTQPGEEGSTWKAKLVPAKASTTEPAMAVVTPA